MNRKYVSAFWFFIACFSVYSPLFSINPKLARSYATHRQNIMWNHHDAFHAPRFNRHSLENFHRTCRCTTQTECSDRYATALIRFERVLFYLQEQYDQAIILEEKQVALYTAGCSINRTALQKKFDALLKPKK